jgi:large subunit ribosomal protein L24
MNKIRKGDSVVVRTGKDKGKLGTVLEVQKDNLVLVEGINLVKKHVKPNPAKGEAGGVIPTALPIQVSNIGLFNVQTGRADRVGLKLLEDGRKVRFFKSTNELVDA